jgi:2,3-bisphosphoglycerate-dependent phosphoglycerate mutase
MPRLIAAIVRHGAYRQLPDTPSAHQPFPLVAAGERQAREAAAGLRTLLAEQDLDLSAQVHSSQLLRAWQTARVMLQQLHDLFPEPPQIAACDELAERSLGSAANLTIAQIEAIVREDPRYPELPPDWKSNSHFRLPLQGAESLLQAGERVATHLRTQMAALAATAGGDTLQLFVGHGAAFRHAAYHLGVLAFDDIRRLSMHHARPVLLEYRAHGPWRHVGGEWKVRGRDTAYTD